MFSFISTLSFIIVVSFRMGRTLSLTFSFLLFSTLHLLVSGANSVAFTLVNECNYTVWPASLTTSRNANIFTTTGFVLKSGETSTVSQPASWAGNFWGRTHCKTDSITGNFSCATGDCGTGKVECKGKGGMPPATLAEFRLGGYGEIDYYDVSVVDGYNVPIEVVPSGTENCSSAGCTSDLNPVCPKELKVTENEQVVACQGACSKFNLNHFCCVRINRSSTIETCEPSAYSLVFKMACPKAYSSPYDNGTNAAFSCSSNSYDIIFCPGSRHKVVDKHNMSKPLVVLLVLGFILIVLYLLLSRCNLVCVKMC